jgi:hypothetical protein
MPTQITVNLIDHSGEMTGTKFYVETLDDSNYDALFDPVTGAVSLLQGALMAATDCEHVSTVASLVSDTGTGVPPATVTAQREIAIRVKVRDTVNGRTGHFSVPGPITTFYPPTGVKDDIVPLDNVVFAALILIIEANMVSRDDNAIEVVEGRLVGRNN